jgi:mono/diheme cytochrome c family protein
MARLIPIALAALVLALGGVACGGDDDEGATGTTTTEETTTETTETTTTGGTSDAGREVFVANCGSCHTLEDAGTSGSIGPALDGIGLSEADIEAQVRSGGGGMPAFEGDLSDNEIAQVSAYVAGNS